jgi:phage protein D/phage baseplate assembly protein gpV
VSWQSAIPEIGLEVNGTRLPGVKIRALSELAVRQKLSAPSQCELVFEDFGLPLTGASGFNCGDTLLVFVGQDAQPLFSGEVTAVTYDYGANTGRRIRVRAYDRLHRLRKNQPVRTHVQVRLNQLAAELAGKAGLKLDGEPGGPVWDRLFQYRQSDLDLLVEVAGSIGVYLFVDGETCRLLTLEGSGTALPLELGRSLMEARVEVNGNTSCRSVRASGWDTSTGKHYDTRASVARSGRDTEAEATPGSAEGAGEVNLMDVAAPDNSHAEAIAQGELDRRTAREVTLWGIAEGDRRLTPGKPVDVTGLDSSICGRYVLTAVEHLISRESGYVSDISTAPPQTAAPVRGANTAPGLVTRVDDPESRGRVQVALPTFGDLETGWMNVIMPGAGGKKGIIAVPDVNDQVLLLFAQEDPSRGIVLGGLYGEGCATPDCGVEGGAVRQYSLRTPGGQRIALNDTRQSVRLEDQKGSFVDISPDGMILHSTVPLTIEAPGQPVVVRGNTIDFEKA